LAVLFTNPFFACPPSGDFRLLGGSSCIDVGTNGAPELPAEDFDGKPAQSWPAKTIMLRLWIIGAYEFNPRFAANSLSLPDLAFQRCGCGCCWQDFDGG